MRAAGGVPPRVLRGVRGDARADARAGGHPGAPAVPGRRLPHPPAPPGAGKGAGGGGGGAHGRTGAAEGPGPHARRGAVPPLPRRVPGGPRQQPLHPVRPVHVRVLLPVRPVVPPRQPVHEPRRRPGAASRARHRQQERRRRVQAQAPGGAVAGGHRADGPEVPRLQHAHPEVRGLQQNDLRQLRHLLVLQVQHVHQRIRPLRERQLRPVRRRGDRPLERAHQRGAGPRRAQAAGAAGARASLAGGWAAGGGPPGLGATCPPAGLPGLPRTQREGPEQQPHHLLELRHPLLRRLPGDPAQRGQSPLPGGGQVPPAHQGLRHRCLRAETQLFAE